MAVNLDFALSANQSLALSELPKGRFGVIKKVGGDAHFRRRLADLGFIEGTIVKVSCCAAFGDPVVYCIRGFRVSLRKSEAANIEVVPIVNHCKNYKGHCHKKNDAF